MGYTLHLTPYTLHLTPYTLHLTPYTLNLTYLHSICTLYYILAPHLHPVLHTCTLFAPCITYLHPILHPVLHTCTLFAPCITYLHLTPHNEHTTNTQHHTTSYNIIQCH